MFGRVSAEGRKLGPGGFHTALLIAHHLSTPTRVVPGITLNITHATRAQVLTVAPQVRTESSLAGTVPFPPPC